MSTPATSATGNPVLIGLGANLPGPHGTPEDTLNAALRFLEQNMVILRRSRLWLTAPVPVSDQPWYHNSVISIETGEIPQGLHAFLKETETRFGRAPGARNAARILDLDLLDWRGQTLDLPGLILPHPRMHLRGFVLYPLQEVAPDWVHPVLKKDIAALLKTLPKEQAAEPLESR